MAQHADQAESGYRYSVRRLGRLGSSGGQTTRLVTKLVHIVRSRTLWHRRQPNRRSEATSPMPHMNDDPCWLRFPFVLSQQSFPYLQGFISNFYKTFIIVRLGLKLLRIRRQTVPNFAGLWESHQIVSEMRVSSASETHVSRARLAGLHCTRWSNSGLPIAASRPLQDKACKKKILH